jgi:hypothetical protein
MVHIALWRSSPSLGEWFIKLLENKVHPLKSSPKNTMEIKVIP